MDRRFFMQFAAAAAGGLLLPKQELVDTTAPQLIDLTATWEAPKGRSQVGWTRPSCGLTYEMLEAAYTSCIVGTEHPSVGYTTPEVLAAMGEMADHGFKESPLLEALKFDRPPAGDYFTGNDLDIHEFPIVFIPKEAQYADQARKLTSLAQHIGKVKYGNVLP